MHPRYRQFGFGDEESAEVQAFVKHARSLGLSRNQVDAFLELNRLGPNEDQKVAAARVQSFYARYRLPQDVRAGLEQYLTGERAVPSAPDRAADARRLREIRDISRSDPWRYDNDADLQEEHHDLVERMSSPTAGSGPHAGGAADGAAGAASSGGGGAGAAPTSTTTTN